MGVEISYSTMQGVSSYVMPREGHGSRNRAKSDIYKVNGTSCPARGMGVEIVSLLDKKTNEESCPARGMGVEMTRTQ